MKVCTVCKEEKTLDNYYKSKVNKDGLGYRCKVCDCLARKKWNDSNPERAAESQRRRNLKHKYGLTPEEYAKVLAEQGGGCGCCGVEYNTSYFGKNSTMNFAVDHCHTTNKVRGLLCNQCNRAIGMLGDTAEGVLRAYEYLKETH